MHADRYQVTVIGGFGIGRPTTLQRAIQTAREALVVNTTVFIKDWIGNTVEMRRTSVEPLAYGVKLHQVSQRTPAWCAEVPLASPDKKEAHEPHD